MERASEGFGVGPLLRFSTFALQGLTDAREEIDALNVYPVPDGDTGTNLFLTFEAAHQDLVTSVEEQGGVEQADLVRSVVAYARGLLMGARGNSGVIMSQLVGALLKSLAAAAPDDRAAQVLADGMVAATAAAYAAVGEPVEGTMLTVAREASEEARRQVADPAVRTAQVLAACATAAREALARTPDQLAVLRNAGVVDAGGRGLCIVLDAAESAYTGRRELVRHAPLGTRAIPIPVPADDLTEDGPAYEVMYLLDAVDEVVPGLRRSLQALGDSLVVVGGDGLWNVHVHVDDVGAAIEAGIVAGRPHRVRVTHFAEQKAAARYRKEPLAKGPRTGRAVVMLAFGDGLARVLTEAGAHVVAATPTRRPSTGELLAAIRATGAAEVVLLPNDRDVMPTANAAAGIAQNDDGIRVAVIPTYASVQGMAALAVHEPGRPFDQDLVEMTAAARHARNGAVTVAVRQAITTAGACEPGDVLGAIEGDFAVVGQDLFAVAVEVVDRMLGGGGELVTVVHGQGGGEELAERCVEYLAAQHPTVEVMVYDGGQERYPLLIGVE